MKGCTGRNDGKVRSIKLRWVRLDAKDPIKGRGGGNSFIGPPDLSADLGQSRSSQQTKIGKNICRKFIGLNGNPKKLENCLSRKATDRGCLGNVKRGVRGLKQENYANVTQGFR